MRGTCANRAGHEHPEEEPELAVEYKAIADRMKQIQMIEEVLHQPGF